MLARPTYRHSKSYDEIILPCVYFVDDVINICVGLLVAVEVNRRIPVITRIFPSVIIVEVLAVGQQVTTGIYLILWVSVSRFVKPLAKYVRWKECNESSINIFSIRCFDRWCRWGKISLANFPVVFIHLRLKACLKSAWTDVIASGLYFSSNWKRLCGVSDG